MGIDYDEIGRNIRKFRKAEGMTQKEMAAKIEISTSHMRNIETGNTKVSLPVLFDIAGILNIGVGDLLNMAKPDRIIPQNDGVNEILDACSEKDLKIMREGMRIVKSVMDQLSI